MIKSETRLLCLASLSHRLELKALFTISEASCIPKAIYGYNKTSN